ncbi:helix-turn-helix transcriptional regulator [uncultured Anaerotruncus sp.]|uniref:helix-turn-helix domain-containing protein n=1 Tax=uncultured Anaerotruncus sp. TaxID=905011 RepID=UPI00258F04F1|nr:helix-turn-helix transcriptional regulator [uncultured Anaerotruncus sp.]
MTVQVLGQKIRYLRRREGLSQEEFAARAGISHRKLSDIECGNGNPTFDTMDCIAAAFGLQIEEQLQPDIEVDLLPRRELSRLQPMVDRLPEAWQELFVRGAEGALAMWLETVRGRE